MGADQLRFRLIRVPADWGWRTLLAKGRSHTLDRAWDGMFIPWVMGVQPPGFAGTYRLGFTVGTGRLGLAGWDLNRDVIVRILPPRPDQVTIAH